MVSTYDIILPYPLRDSLSERARLILHRLQLLGDGAREVAARRDRALGHRREEEIKRQAQLMPRS